jgi:hypothetical protein
VSDAAPATPTPPVWPDRWVAGDSLLICSDSSLWWGFVMFLCADTYGMGGRWEANEANAPIPPTPPPCG